MTRTAQQIGSYFRQALAIAGIILAAIPQDSIPTVARGVVGTLGVVILAVEHYVGDPSTGTTPLTPVQGTAVSQTTEKAA